MSRLREGVRLRVARESVWSQLGDEIVVLDLSTSSYLGLENVGARVWEMLAEPRTVLELESALGAIYEVDPSVLSGDLRPFLEELLARRLLVADDEDTVPLP